MIVYLITNQVNGKMYVGCTAYSLEARWYAHLKNSQYVNYALYKAMRKYGVENFSVKKLMDCSDEDHMLLMETAFIAEFDTFGKSGYNMTIGGQSGPPPFSDKAKKKMSVSARQPHRSAMSSKYAKALWINPGENAAKLSKANIKRFQDPDQVRQRSENQKSIWSRPEYREVQLHKLAKAREVMMEKRRALVS